MLSFKILVTPFHFLFFMPWNFLLFLVSSFIFNAYVKYMSGELRTTLDLVNQRLLVGHFLIVLMVAQFGFHCSGQNLC